ncbi:MAG: FliM/FliN family flagellar motor switch protein [Acidobacteriota bacterium]
MSRFEAWAGRLQQELARELGQPLTLSPASEGPEPANSVCDLLTAPGARILLMADAEGVAGFLVEARVIEAGQADREMVRELWSGILASVAAGMGGQATPGQAPEGATEPWTLRLGEASVRLALAGETKKEPIAPPVAPPAEAPPPATRPAQRAAGNFDLLLEVELDAAVRFGSREMELKDLLELGPGDVVELDRLVADPVDLIVGDRIVARGEVVLVNGNFGLRVTEVAEPVRRLESIRCLW